MNGVSRGRTLSDDVFTEIVAKSDGVPLFVEELTKTMLESDATPTSGRREIPKTLQASLLARLDRLGGAKEVAQLAAVLGREFPYEWLRAVSPFADDVLEVALERPVGAELLFKRGPPSQAGLPVQARAHRRCRLPVAAQGQTAVVPSSGRGAAL